MNYTQLSETRPKARKQYGCIWCTEKIEVGEKHIHRVGIYDGLQDDRWHTECYDVSLLYFKETRESEFEPHACKRGSLEEA